LIDHRRNGEIRAELQIFDIKLRIKDYQTNWSKHLGRMEKNTFPKLLRHYKPIGRGDQERQYKVGEDTFEVSCYNLEPET
jgi:hypothetical protein